MRIINFKLAKSHKNQLLKFYTKSIYQISSKKQLAF